MHGGWYCQPEKPHYIATLWFSEVVNDHSIYYFDFWHFSKCLYRLDQTTLRNLNAYLPIALGNTELLSDICVVLQYQDFQKQNQNNVHCRLDKQGLLYPLLPPRWSSSWWRLVRVQCWLLPTYYDLKTFDQERIVTE